ncbi:MAG TPA: metal ABC transporter ATP-binding protein [Desulfobacteraceae bacterium]|nr:metal ABC transporter ATP-binding protein [Desulfobacteraceae bacterium]
MEGQPVIEIEDLWFSYNGNVVLKNVHFKVEAGDFLAIIGPNGGGKTTLIKLILGIMRPDRGRIRVFGGPPRRAAHRIGYVPQDIRVNKEFPIAVEDVVRMGLIGAPPGAGKGSAKTGTQGVVQDALERVEMWEYRKRRMGELSGGQRQRVVVARALVTQPDLLVLDEPMANVDPKGQTDFYHYLQEINDRVTITVVSHDFMVLSSYIRSVACVSREVFFHDAPEITQDMLQMAYHCPVELVAHGTPHRVLHLHQEDGDD